MQSLIGISFYHSSTLSEVTNTYINKDQYKNLDSSSTTGGIGVSAIQNRENTPVAISNYTQQESEYFQSQYEKDHEKIGKESKVQPTIVPQAIQSQPTPPNSSVVDMLKQMSLQSENSSNQPTEVILFGSSKPREMAARLLQQICQTAKFNSSE